MKLGLEMYDGGPGEESRVTHLEQHSVFAPEAVAMVVVVGITLLVPTAEDAAAGLLFAVPEAGNDADLLILRERERGDGGSGSDRRTATGSAVMLPGGMEHHAPKCF